VITGDRDEEIDKDRYISPSNYPVELMLTDVKIEDIREYSNQFGFEYNSVYKYTDINNLSFPVNGIVAEGTHGRVFVPMVVHFKTKYVRSLFLVDTGAPYVYSSKETFECLGIREYRDTRMRLFIQGRAAVSYMSTNHFDNVNVIGVSYMSKQSLQLSVRYDINKAS